MPTPRRIGTEQSATRAVLLDGTEKLLREEGYAAVSTRRVAKAVGLTPALVHYYYPTTDDLLIAVYRRAVDYTMARLAAALAADRPLHALWELGIDPTCTALAIEYMALANHRKAIRSEIVASADLFRAAHAEGLAKILRGAEAVAEPGLADPMAMTIFLASVSRLLVMEQALGIGMGHDAATAAVEAWLGRVEPR